MTVRGLLLRETSPLFDVLQPLFIATAEKKDGELKNRVHSHIVFPLTSLLLSISLSLSLCQGEQAGVSTLGAKFAEPFAPRFGRVLRLRDVCILHQTDKAA